MEFSEFLTIVEDIKRKNPIWFEIDNATPVNESDIARVEKQLSISLPQEYKLFISMFGGGYFASPIFFQSVILNGT